MATKRTKRSPARAKPAKKAAARKKAAPRHKRPAKKTAKPKKKSPARKAAKKAPKKAKSSPKRAGSGKKTARVKTPPRRTAARRTHRPADGIAPYRQKRGETYMNENQREHFRRILLSWKRELMEEVDRTVHHMQDEASNFPDPNDRASQESEFSLELRTRDRERKLLRKIDEALKRLELNEYGWCDTCGAEIGVRRLEARPTATLCIDCKTLDEIRERQKRG